MNDIGHWDIPARRRSPWSKCGRLVARVLLAYVLIAFALPTRALADDGLDERFKFVSVQMNEARTELSTWERDAQISLTLVLLIGVLGALAAGLQGLPKRPSIPLVTAVLGVAITIGTLVNNTLLDEDYRTLRKRVSEGRSLLTGADMWLKQGGASETALKKIEEKMVRFAALATSRTGSSGAPGLMSLTVLHASPAPACGCATLPQDEVGFVFACGSASSKSVEQSTAQATDSAIAQMAAMLAGQSKKPADVAPETVDYVRRVSTEADSCVKQANGTYNVAVTIKLPRSLATRGAQSAYARQAPVVDVGSQVPSASGEIQVPRAQKGDLVVPVRANPSKYGDFAFSFDVNRTRNVLELRDILVKDDGSGGATDWEFRIFVDGVAAAEISRRSYSDDAKPPVYKAAATIPFKADARIKVLGYRYR